MVPNGWKKGVIEDIAKVSSGGTPSRQNDSYWLDGQIPWVTTTEVQFGVINDTGQKITEAGLKNSSAKLFPKDTILMAMYGQGKTRGQVAKLGIDASTNQACAALLLNDGFEVDYYYQYLVSQYKNIRELANSGGQQNLSAGIIKGIHVPIPPQLEQRKIAKILSTWDKTISTTERLIDNSKQQKKALMQQLLTGKKRLIHSENDGFSVREGFAKAKLGELPNDWNVCLLSEFYWYQEGPGVRKHQFTTSGVKLFNGTNIQNSRINLFNTETHVSSEEAEGAYSHFLADAGDLVIACSGISVDKFDEKIAFIKKEHLPLCMNTSTMRFKVKEDADACLTFLQYFMMSPFFKNQIRRQITGSAQLNFGPSHVGKCFIAMPSLAEQKKISALLSLADNEIDLLEQQLADLKQEKKGLMQQLLTGKRRVKLDDKEVA
jgi:type I restriction enzyme S subunit